MRALPAAAIACLASAGCSFRAPAAADAEPAAADGPPISPPACWTDAAYVEHEGHRYRILPQNTDYDTAIDRCAADGAHLAVVDSQGENDYLKTLHTADMWIGFDDLTEETAFRWVTGAATTFTGWSGGEPNDNTVEDCAYLRPNGTWNDTNCGDQKRPLCECDPAYHPPPTPACRMGATGSTTRNGRRYFVRTSRTWEAAKADCEAIGAHMLVINDADENSDIDNFTTGLIWIGYTDSAAEGTFQWINGSPSTFHPWQGGAVPVDEAQDCAVLQDSGLWIAVPCTDVHSTLCECDPLPP